MKKPLKVVKESMDLDKEEIEKITAELEADYTPAERFIEAMILVRNGVDPESIEFDKLGADIGLAPLKVQAIRKICQAEELTFDELGVMILNSRTGKPMTDMAAHALWTKAADKFKKTAKKLGLGIQDILKVM